MDNRILQTKFVADALIGHIRRGRLPSTAEATAIDRLPWIESLRKSVMPSDQKLLVVLFRAIKTESGPIGGLAVSLLQNLIPDVRQLLMDRWDTADPYLRNRIMWRLLGFSKLGADWHERFRQFVLQQPDVFQDFNRDWYGESQHAVARIVMRLNDERVPRSKKWIYLYTIPTVVADRSVAEGLIDYYSNVLGIVISKAQIHSILAALSPATSCATSSTPTDFVAGAVMKHLRLGNHPSADEVEVLNAFPFIDELRKAMKPSDLDWLLPVVRERQDAIAAFYLGLLHSPSVDNREVQQMLHHRWESASPYYRAHLFWRILDNVHLSIEWHERLFEFALSEWPQFVDVSRKFHADSREVTTDMLKQIGDDSCPELMKWAYLCRTAAIGTDYKAAMALLKFGIMMPHPFNRRVAAELLNRLNSCAG